MEKEQWEAAWRIELEKVGPENVRARISSGGIGIGGSAAVPFILVQEAPYAFRSPPRSFVEAWLSKKGVKTQTKISRQRNFIIAISVLALVVAIITLFL